MSDAMERKELLLVVDDEAGMRDTLIDILEEYEWRPQLACNGLEAVNMVETGDYALVLMDLRMPVMSGIEALARIAQMRPRLPVIMMSAYADQEAMEAAERYGARALMRKPLDWSKLLPLIEQAVSEAGGAASAAD